MAYSDPFVDKLFAWKTNSTYCFEVLTNLFAVSENNS